MIPCQSAWGKWRLSWSTTQNVRQIWGVRCRFLLKSACSHPIWIFQCLFNSQIRLLNQHILYCAIFVSWHSFISSISTIIICTYFDLFWHESKVWHCVILDWLLKTPQLWMFWLNQNICKWCLGALFINIFGKCTIYEHC